MKILWNQWSIALAAAAAIALAPGRASAGENFFWYGDQLSPPLAGGLHRYLLTPSSALGGFSPFQAIVGPMMSFNNWPGEEPGLKLWDKGETWDGYTLLSSLGGHLDAQGRMNFAILIDMQGNVVKEWPLAAFPAKMLPNGDVIAHADIVPNHQEYGTLVQMDWCEKRIWSWSGTGDENARVHHDFEREGSPVGYYSPHQAAKTHSGTTLVLRHFNPAPELTQNITDFSDADGPWGLEDDAIEEVNWKGEVIWSWHAYQHHDQMGWDALAREAVRTQMIGAPSNIGGGFRGDDWQHINNAAYLGPNKWYDQGDLRFHPDNIIWDGRSSNIIAIIARRDHPEGQWKSGDIVWRTGPHYYYGTPGYKVGQIIGQHHAHMIPEGLPGAGNILVFDNGGVAGFGSLVAGGPPFWPSTLRDFSRVVEFNPTTMEVVWEYANPVKKPEARKFFSWYISSAQRLPNGNTLITEGDMGRLFEVTREGKIVWEYISPFKALKDADPAIGFDNDVYRAYRVPYWWVPRNKKCPQNER